jgi:hypothetical protein
VFEKGYVGVAGNVSTINRTTALPKSYPATNYEWIINGANNKNLSIYAAHNGRALKIEANTVGQGKSIALTGNAVGVLFGKVNYQIGGSTIKPSATGTLEILEQSTAVIKEYPLWKRLGDCSVNNKTLTVEYDSIVSTYTFNKNYTSADTEDAILADINSKFASDGCDCTISTIDIKNAWDNINVDEKVYIKCTQSDDVEEFCYVTENGKRCDDTTPKDDVFGLCVKSTINGDYMPVWRGAYRYGNIYTHPNGLYGIGSDGKISQSATIKIGRMLNGILYRL